MVPGRGEVMAASRPANTLKRVDFPEFGAPRIATSSPSRRRSAPSESASSRSIPRRTPPTSARTSGATSAGTSSSAQSIVTSTSAAARTRSARHASARRCNAPPRPRVAWRRWRSVSAAKRSPRASISARSMRPASKARRVNSPGSASRQPDWRASRSRTAATTARPPWQCNSAIASPV